MFDLQRTAFSQLDLLILNVGQLNTHVIIVTIVPSLQRYGFERRNTIVIIFDQDSTYLPYQDHYKKVPRNSSNFSGRQPPEAETDRDRSWIASDTWKLIDRRAQLRRRQVHGLFRVNNNTETIIQELGRNIHHHLRRDRQRSNKVGIEIENFYARPNTRSFLSPSWLVQEMYRAILHSKPLWQDLETTRQSFRKLYQYAPRQVAPSQSISNQNRSMILPHLKPNSSPL